MTHAITSHTNQHTHMDFVVEYNFVKVYFVKFPTDFVFLLSVYNQ